MCIRDRGFLLNQGLPERLQVALSEPADQPVQPQASIAPAPLTDDTCVLSASWWAEPIGEPRPSTDGSPQPTSAQQTANHATATALR